MRRSSWRLGRLNSRCWNVEVRVSPFVDRSRREFVHRIPSARSHARCTRSCTIDTHLHDVRQGGEQVDEEVVDRNERHPVTKLHWRTKDTRKTDQGEEEDGGRRLKGGQ